MTVEFEKFKQILDASIERINRPEEQRNEAAIEQYYKEIKILEDSGIVTLFQKIIDNKIVRGGSISFNQPPKGYTLNSTSITLAFNQSQDGYDFCKLFVHQNQKVTDNPNNGYYQDEIHYCAMEIYSRNHSKTHKHTL